MGFRIRKSVRVGPFRFNVSKSGVGVSAGVKGFRVGTGPRGNYVHMGAGGVYFRRSLNPAGATDQRSDKVTPQGEPSGLPESATVGPMQEIESASVLEMVDSSSAELLEEINAKQKKTRLFPMALGLGLVISIALIGYGVPGWLVIVWLVLASLGAFAAWYRDQLAKSVVILYDFDAALEEAYGGIHDAFKALSDCAKVWHIEATGQIRDRKYHAGANTAVSRQRISSSDRRLPFIKTNIEVPIVPAGKQKLAFMPDRLLVFEKNAVGAVPYKKLKIKTSETRFVEEEGVPADSKVVDHTWQYVNKRGGPDRRFKDNRQLPIALYEQLHLQSESGLNEMFQLSKVGVGSELGEAVEQLASSIDSQTGSDG